MARLSFLLCILFLSPCQARALDTTYQEQLIAKATQQNLSSDRQWHTLLHYHHSWSGAESSLIQNHNFFLSEDGASNPQAELKESLLHFFDPVNPEAVNNHPQCRYPARYSWLKKKLGFNSAELTEVHCPEFRTWKEALNASKIVLIFSAAFLNNPASMFGHTFLRIDPPTVGSDNLPLLAYAANYAAETQGDPGLLFAYKGIFGGYQGYFSVAPYAASRLPFNAPTPKVRLDQSHVSLRVSLDTGFDDRKSFYGVSFRPTYHQILDPEGGYTRGASLAAGEITLRQREEEQLKIENISLLQLESLAPSIGIITPLSWRADIAASRDITQNKSRSLISHIEVGFGKAFETTPSTMTYFFGDTRAEFSSEIEKGGAFGVGPRAGIIFDWNDSLRTQLDGSWKRFGFEEPFTRSQIKIAHRIRLSEDNALTLSIAMKDDFNHTASEGIASWQWYF